MVLDFRVSFLRFVDVAMNFCFCDNDIVFFENGWDNFFHIGFVLHEFDSIEDVSKVAKLEGSKRMNEILKVSASSKHTYLNYISI